MCLILRTFLFQVAEHPAWISYKVWGGLQEFWGGSGVLQTGATGASSFVALECKNQLTGFHQSFKKKKKKGKKKPPFPQHFIPSHLWTVTEWITGWSGVAAICWVSPTELTQGAKSLYNSFIFFFYSCQTVLWAQGFSSVVSHLSPNSRERATSPEAPTWLSSPIFQAILDAQTSSSRVVTASRAEVNWPFHI